MQGFSTEAISTPNGDENLSLPEFFLEDLAVTYLRWRWMLSKKRFTESMRRAIQDDGQRRWSLIDVIHRFMNNDFPIELGMKLHKVCDWVRWITVFGAPENYSSEIWEGAHKLVKRWRSSMSWKTQGAASRKVMQAHSIYDAHASDPSNSALAPISSGSLDSVWSSVDMKAPPGWLCKITAGTNGSGELRSSRFGLGGFRGRSTVGHVFDVSWETTAYVSAWKLTADRRRFSFHDRIVYYTESIAPCHRAECSLLIRLLSSTFQQRGSNVVHTLTP